MTQWKDDIEKRMARLEQRTWRVPEDEYTPRSMLEDGKLRESIDRGSKTWKVCPINLYDDIGAAADRAPKDATYIVSASSTGLTAERVATGTATVTWDMTVAGEAKANVPDAAITLAKMANLDQDKFIVRTTASTGVPETATCTAFARTILDDVNAAAVRSTIGADTGSGTVTSVSGTTPISSSGGATPAISLDNAGVTYAKIQNVSATDKVLGRSSSGAGSVEEIACTSFARSILDDATAGEVLLTLGLEHATTVKSFHTLNVDVNQANTDVATFGGLPSKYAVNRLWGYSKTGTPTSATIGLFTAASGGGTTLVTTVDLGALTASESVKQFILTTPDAFTGSTLYLHTTVAAGAAATVNFMLEVVDLS